MVTEKIGEDSGKGEEEQKAEPVEEKQPEEQKAEPVEEKKEEEEK